MLLHLLCWVTFFGLPYLFFLPIHHSEHLFLPRPDFNHTRNAIGRDTVANVLLVIFFYANIYVFTPRYYLNRRYVAFVAIAVVYYLAVGLAPITVFPYGPDGLWYEDKDAMQIVREISHHLLRFTLVFFVSLLWTINDRWKRSQKEKLNAELLYLKSQINPHFLFNTLNSIYALAVTRSDKTADALVKLSGMMRYITSDVHGDTVPLEKEITYVNSYVDLQKLRLGNTVDVRLETGGDFRGKQIEPLLLLPFIENAFKYGVNPEAVDAYVHIGLFVDGDELSLSVRNLKVRRPRNDDEASGVGIENTRRRLGLLFPGKHRLLIDDAARIFSVALTIDLA